MKTRIVSLLDLKKTTVEREAENLLAELREKQAIQVTLSKSETARKIGHIFRKAAKTLNKEITTRTKEGTVIIRLKQTADTKKVD